MAKMREVCVCVCFFLGGGKPKAQKNVLKASFKDSNRIDIKGR